MKLFFEDIMFWINFTTAALILSAIIFKPIRNLFSRFFLVPENEQNCKIDGLKDEISILKEEIKLQRQCNLAILHDRIFQSCEYFIRQDEISMNELVNLDKLYKSYSGIDGNGLCEELVGRVKNLKLKEGDQQNGND